MVITNPPCLSDLSIERCEIGVRMAFLYICPLKEHCHEIFRALFLCLKHSIWAPYEQAKAFSRLFCFSRRYALAKFKIGMTMQTR